MSDDIVREFLVESSENLDLLDREPRRRFKTFIIGTKDGKLIGMKYAEP